ncbi:hypothetical protein ACFE04_026916 [Oxalis oulophora]
MENCEINGSYSSFGSTSSLQQPDFNKRAVHEALKHLASIDLLDLCNEAKVERCRATRDLRSCARYVQHVLTSCGHASLCAECSQRCDICPICITPIRSEGNRIRIRLYYECIEAGLISKRFDERFQDNDNGEDQVTADITDVTDVCMDESAVSSDPFVAILLDEVVVKDWCKRTFKKITTELKGIYNLALEQMKPKLSLLLRLSMQLTGISNVIDVLDSSFKGNLSAQLHELHHLQESILKTKQHSEIMMWCIRQDFLENIRCRHSDVKSWGSLVSERKSAAITRAWPNPVDYSADSPGQCGSLFIEDALGNLYVEPSDAHDVDEEIELVQNDGGSSFFRTRIEGMTGCYPFENLRAATDILFLNSSSDLVVAKQAILKFLYYLFDRHWTLPDAKWRHVVDDFAATFNIARHLLLESLVFYLLDDNTDEALQEACHLLPEICGPETHPKIARVLLERQNPDTALMVLRWSGRDSLPQFFPLNDAVTAVRVRVECGLLTEAFTYQRMLCSKVREAKLDDINEECRNPSDWVETLVSEICCLCIWRNLVDRMIELPWNTDEEKYVHKCLLDSAISDPSTTTGSLLVVYYLQRYQYAEAYQVNLKFQNVEQEFILCNSISREMLSKMTSATHWRKELVDKCVELLPEVEKQKIKSLKLSDITAISDKDAKKPAKSGSPEKQQFKSTDSLSGSSLLLQIDHMASPLKTSAFESPSHLDMSLSNPPFEHSNIRSSSILSERLFDGTPNRRVGLSNNVKFDNGSTPGRSPMNATPFKDLSRSSLRMPPNSQHKDKPTANILPEMEENGYRSSEFRTSSPPYSRRVTANPAASPYSNSLGLFKESLHGMQSDVGRRTSLEINNGPRSIITSDDQMEVSWSNGEVAMPVEDKETNGGLRWRTDDTSDEEEQSPDRRALAASETRKVVRRKRVSRI